MSNVSYINVNGHLYPFDDPQLTEEVENIRIGADGKQYGSAGDALRSQLDDINDGLETAQNNITQIDGEQDSEKEGVSQAQGNITTLQNDASALATDISNTNSGLAPAFSESVTYAIGDYCMHNGTLYKAVAEHTGAWTDADFEAVPVGGELEAVNAETAEAQEITQTVSGNKMGALIDTASGSIASFYPDSTIPTVKGLTVNVEPVQDLHGYDSPWPAGGGINKLDPTVSYSGLTYNPAVGRVFTPTVSAKKWTDNGDGTFSNTLGDWAQAGFVIGPLPTGAVYFSFASATGGLRISVFVMDSEYAVNRVSLNRNPITEGEAVTVNTTFSGADTYLGVYIGGAGQAATISQPYVYAGADASIRTYYPYSNICHISGWDAVEVDRTGVNVWDEEWEVGDYNIYTGAKTNDSSRIRSKNFIPVSPNTTYFFNTATYKYVLEYDVEQNYIGVNSNTSPNSRFTTGDNTRFITFYLINRTTYNNDISINYPSTDTAYHSGKDNATYTIQLGQTVYGGKLDVTGGKMVVDRAYKVYDGSSDEKIQMYSGTRFIIGASGYVSPATSIVDNIKASYLKTIYKGAQGATLWAISGSDAGRPELMTNFGLSTIAEIREYLANNPLEVVYPLATPITIDLTPIEISVLTGQTNNVWADSGDVSVEYAADLKTYINNKIAAAVAALS